MKTQKQFYGRALVARAFGLLVLLALAVLLAACTADTVNINGTYEHKSYNEAFNESAVLEWRLKRGDGNNVTGEQYSNVENRGWNKDGDLSGKLKGYEPIKLNLTFLSTDGKTSSIGDTDVLDYGNKIKVGNLEFTKKK